MTFFEKYYQHMLVINGVDAQTNSHTVGIVHNWSGRNSDGYPTLSALLAAYYAPALPIPYLSFGGYSQTAGVTRFTRIDRADLLRAVADPGGKIWNLEERIISGANWEALKSYRSATAEHLAATPNPLPADERHLNIYRSALAHRGTEGVRGCDSARG